MGKIVPKTDEYSRRIWASIEAIARKVETWPAWKKGGKSTPSPQNKGEADKLLASKTNQDNGSSHNNPR